MPKPKNEQRRARGTKPIGQIKIAKERIAILIEEASRVHTTRPDLARRYFQLAKKIGMRYNVRIPRQAKRKFCKYCFSYLAEGWRFKKGRASVVCRNCGKIIRYPYKPKKTRSKHI
jgi:ribonuclease P protein subunit RPR2